MDSRQFEELRNWVVTISSQLDQMQRVLQEISDNVSGNSHVVNSFAKPIEYLNGDTFGDRLRDACKQRNMTATDLGTRIGVNNSTISRYMNNKSYPKKWIIKNISDTLMIPMDLLTVSNSGDSVCKE